MKTELKKFLSIANMALLTLTISSCANRPYEETYHKDRSNVIDETQSVSAAASATTEAQDFIEIKFPVGSSKLQDSDKQSLSSLLEASNQQGEIDEVHVLSWSDQEFPSEKSQGLTKGQRELAERRNFEVKSYLKQVKNMDVDTHNMAERSGTFAMLVDTSDKRLKDSLLNAGLATNSDTQNMVRKASHSVVLVKVKD